MDAFRWTNTLNDAFAVSGVGNVALKEDGWPAIQPTGNHFTNLLKNDNISHGILKVLMNILSSELD